MARIDVSDMRMWEASDEAFETALEGVEEPEGTVWPEEPEVTVSEMVNRTAVSSKAKIAVSLPPPLPHLRPANWTPNSAEGESGGPCAKKDPKTTPIKEWVSPIGDAETPNKDDGSDCTNGAQKVQNRCKIDPVIEDILNSKPGFWNPGTISERFDRLSGSTLSLDGWNLTIACLLFWMVWVLPFRTVRGVCRAFKSLCVDVKQQVSYARFGRVSHAIGVYVLTVYIVSGAMIVFLVAGHFIGLF